MAKKKPKSKVKLHDPKKKPKCNAAELAVRVEEVIRIRIDGAQIHDVREYASEKGWALTTRTLQDYISRADKILCARLEKDTDKVFARMVAQREMLFARSVNAADYRTALAVSQDEARLRGLYPAEKKQLEITLPMPDLSKISADELLALIARIGPLFDGTALGGGVPEARPRPLLVAVEPALPQTPLPRG